MSSLVDRHRPTRRPDEPASRGSWPHTSGHRGHDSPHARLRLAALDLFAADGYEATTVDEIAQRAGMSRRTFFRYFSSKEDVIFPDHDTLLEAVEALLRVPPVASPLATVCAAMVTVFESYLAEPDVALQRYRLTHTIATLRDREIASVSRYQRVLTSYLGAHYGRSAEAALRAELIAASVIAAHNQVLRRWLRRGGTGRPKTELDRAFDVVRSIFEPAQTSADRLPTAPSPTVAPPVIAVFRSSLRLDEIIDQIGHIAEPVAGDDRSPPLRVR